MNSVEPGGQSFSLLPSHEPSAGLIQPRVSCGSVVGAVPASYLPRFSLSCQLALPVVSGVLCCFADMLEPDGRQQQCGRQQRLNA